MKYIEDINWLLKRNPDATESDKDMFIDKVAVCVINGLSEDEARREVLIMIKEKV